MKLQPFLLFEKKYIAGLINLGRIYFVLQSYPRGAAEGKIPVLLSDYTDPGLAEGHLKAVRHDANSDIINIDSTEGLQKLRSMLSTGSGYLLYWATTYKRALVLDKLKRDYKENVRKYIGKFTRWEVKGNDNIDLSLQVVFGELSGIITYNGSDTIEVKLEELENI